MTTRMKILGAALAFGIAFGAAFTGQARATELTLTTTFAGGNQNAGNMFDLTVTGTETIGLTGRFDVHTNSTGSETFEVYYRFGGYAGFDDQATAWTLLGSSTAMGMGLGAATPIDVGNTLWLEPGDVIGLYVHMASFEAGARALQFTNLAGSTSYSNDEITITAGISKGDPAFAGTFTSNRAWNGTVYYAIPEPASLSLLGLMGLGLLRRR